MANVNIPIADVGVVDFQQGDDFSTTELFNSLVPLPVTEDFHVAAATVLPAYSVVGLDGTGALVLAQTSGTAVQPIGVTVTSKAAGAAIDRIAVYRAGNFNPAALNWHADYDTIAKRKIAFRGSPSPTNILIRERL